MSLKCHTLCASSGHVQIPVELKPKQIKIKPYNNHKFLLIEVYFD